MQSARGLVGKNMDKFIIAEPVGSCTDLQATVLAPLRSIYRDEFNIAPLIVLVDSSRLSSDELEALSIGGYLRKHQIEEAEYIVLSKVDMISKERLQELISSIGGLNQKAKIISYSALTGQGIEEIMGIIDSDQKSNGVPIDVDYDTYAKAEAELGWYNGHIKFTTTRTDAYDLGTRILKHIAEKYDPEDIAHAKVMLSSKTSSAKISLIFRNFP